ncbi:MAG TPA: hypothetical protein VG897_07665 [Terriglobales bacterium]|nr:hypothetical protein [Terriglobales bacterium]
MKTRKVNKRLSKLDALLLDLSEKYSKGALHVHAALEGVKVAVAHLRTAVISENSSDGAAKSSPPPAPRTKPAKKKLSAAHKRTMQEGTRRRAVVKKSATAAPSLVTKRPARSQKANQ